MASFSYEEEINKRNDAENEFVMIKKVEYAIMVAMIDVNSVCACLMRMNIQRFINLSMHEM